MALIVNGTEIKSVRVTKNGNEIEINSIDVNAGGIIINVFSANKNIIAKLVMNANTNRTRSGSSIQNYRFTTSGSLAATLQSDYTGLIKDEIKIEFALNSNKTTIILNETNKTITQSPSNITGQVMTATVDVNLKIYLNNELLEDYGNIITYGSLATGSRTATKEKELELIPA